VKSSFWVVWRLWTGQYPLVQAFWGFGFVGWWALLFAMAFVISFLRAHGGGNFLLPIGVALHLVYGALVGVGIWRSADNYKGSAGWSIAAKIVVGLVAFNLALNMFRGGGSRLFDAMMSSN
jgi:hypothetical protein